MSASIIVSIDSYRKTGGLTLLLGQIGRQSLEQEDVQETRSTLTERLKSVL